MKSTLTPKERILATAYTLFYKQGYNVTGINQILEEAKVAKASLYQHFGSKEELGIQYIKEVRKDWFFAFEAHLSKNQGPKQKILAAFDFLEMNMKLNSYRGCRFLNLLSDVDTTSKGMQTQVVEHKSKLRNVFKSLVDEYTGAHTQLAILNAHDTIYLLFEAAIMESKLYKDAWPIVAAKTSVNNILNLKV